MNVADPAVPFAPVAEELRAADFVFANLECCLYEPPEGHAVEHEGFFADPDIAGEALKIAGIAAVGLANNVNYGGAAITGSIAQLDRIAIAHTGAGADLSAARAPAIVSRGGLRVGVLQRSSVYWPTNHEATARAGGIGIPGHTAYQVPAHKARPELPPMNRPGHPLIIVTGPTGNSRLCRRHRRAAPRAIVVASCHWGLGVAWSAASRSRMPWSTPAPTSSRTGRISLPVEMYRKPDLYGLGSFSFHTGYGGDATATGSA
jgi:poly-gamma-glutamate synthesis protein (capsule biosynthesis protein)